MDARAITNALGGKWQGLYGLCRCPTHADSTPSLKISDSTSRGIDVHCFAGCDWKDIKSELRRQGLLTDNFSVVDSRPKVVVPVAEPKDNTPAALRLWRESVPLPRTLGENYFIQHRGLPISELNLEHAVRYHRIHRIVVALMTEPATNKPCGIHRIFLNADGSKRQRKMLGRQGVVRITPKSLITERNSQKMPGKGRPFQKGVSGNRGGRPRQDPEVRALCEKFTPGAIATLA